MNILAMDTSNQILGAALLRDKELVASYITNVKRNHSVRLMPAVQDLMQEVGMKPEELDGIVVANGPGSYTGVRIGVTTAKTLAWSLGIPVKAVSSLEVLAWQAKFSNRPVCTFFDARRGLVFAGLYRFGDGKAVQLAEERNMLMRELLQELREAGEPILFISPDLAVHHDLITEMMGNLAIIPDGASQYPNPADLAFCGMTKEETPVHEFVPNYMRLAEAEANWLKMNEGSNRHE